MGVLDKKLFIILFIIVFISFTYTPTPFNSEPAKAESVYPFQQELMLPFDENVFSSPVEYQPIDILINFNDPCWA